MTLQWTTLEIPVGGGLDTKTNEKLLRPPVLADLKNAVFTTSGSYRTRFGYTKLAADTSLVSIASLVTRQSELAACADNKFYAYQGLVNNTDWDEIGNFAPIKVTQESLNNQASEQTLADTCVHQGVRVTCWYDSDSSTIEWTATEELTGRPLSSNNSIASSTKAKLVPSQNSILLVYYNSGATSIRCTVIPTYDPTSSSDVEVEANADSDGIFYAQYREDFSDKAVVVFKYNGGTPAVHAGYLDGGGTLSSETVVNSDANERDVSCLALSLSNLYAFLCGYDPTGNYFWAKVLTTAFAEESTDSQNLAESQNAIACAISDGELGQTGTNLHVWFEEGQAGETYEELIYYYKGTATTWTRAGDMTPLYGLTLASAGIAVGTEGYVVTCYDTPLQSTYFLMNSAGSIEAKFCQGNAGGALPSLDNAAPYAVLPGLQKVSDKIYYAGVYREKLNIEFPYNAAVTTENFAQRGVKLITLDFGYSPQFAEYGEATYISGGYLREYDGVNLVEQGFHVYPENATAVAAASTGSMSDGTYNYRIYYEWTNARGERQRSTTARVITVTVDNTGSSEDTVNFSIYSLPKVLTTKPDVSIVVYRTIANANVVGGGAFYRVTSADPASTGLNSYIVNDPTALTISWSDGMTDADLITKELDYLNTGELDNVAPEAASVIGEAKRRVWLAGFEDGSKVQYSKLNLGREQLSFNDGLYVQLPEEGGPVTAISELKHFVAIFKENRTYVLSGDGPDNLGRGFFNEPQLVDVGLGCIDQRSVAIIPSGVMFQSNKGIWLLGQNLDMQYVGAPVEAYNSQTITSATVLHDDNQVRFLTSSGRTLVYDYLIGQWSTFTNHEGTSAVLWNNTYTYARNNGKVYKESDTYTDDGIFYSMELRTAPIALKGTQGFQSVRNLMLLGEYYNAHNLRVRVSYDHEPDFTDTATWDPSGSVSVDTYGSSTYGSGTYGGSGSPVYQAEFHLPRQKCSVVQFLIDSRPSGSVYGQSMEIVSLQMEVGARTGTNKVATSRQFG